MSYSNESMDMIISTFQECGIVTREDCKSLDSRPFAREIVDEMKRRGYSNVDYAEESIEGYNDYTGVLYDTEQYDSVSAKEYLKKYILK